MVQTKDIQISDYRYDLPEERIAKYPVAVRDETKLLYYHGGEISESGFRKLPELLPAGSLMVFNNTKVIQARLHFRKETGALIEIFCLEPHLPNDYQLVFDQRERCHWVCLVGNRKKWKEGKLFRQLTVGGQEVLLAAEEMENRQGHSVIEFSWNNHNYTFADILDAVGELPIPPYLNRDTEERDKETYQTVYSKIEGSVAAPTAGLHFTQRVLDEIDRRGIERDEITLHVGAGTFKPVKSDTIENHEMLRTSRKHSKTHSSRRSLHGSGHHLGAYVGKSLLYRSHLAPSARCHRRRTSRGPVGALYSARGKAGDHVGEPSSYRQLSGAHRSGRSPYEYADHHCAGLSLSRGGTHGDQFSHASKHVAPARVGFYRR